MAGTGASPAGRTEVSGRVIEERLHSRCVVCGRDNLHGLGLAFTWKEDGSVEGTFDCAATFQGYPHQLHGGVIAMLLDAAMTHCLFSRSKVGVTAELSVRYRQPVKTDRPATIRAWVEHSHPPLIRLAAELIQDGETKVTGSAKFMVQRAERNLNPPPTR